MTIEVPSGGNDPKLEPEAPEMAPAVETELDMDDAIADASNSTNEKCKKTTRAFAFVAALVVLAAIAILVALLPDWDKNKPENINNMTSNLDTSETGTEAGSSEAEVAPLFFESKGAFEIKIPLLSSDITNPYTSVDEAKHDIEQLAKLVVNSAITERSSWGSTDGPLLSPEDGEMFLGSAADGDKVQGSGTSSGSAFEGADSFETYQQEAGVVRSDFVKSTGKLIFAAVTDKILVWDLEGTLLKTVGMPPINVTDDGYGVTPYPIEDSDVEVLEDGEEEPVEEENVEKETVTADARSSVVWGWNPTPYIQGLMLNAQGTRLTAIVGGYGIEHGMGKDVVPVISDYKETRIFVYDINEDGSLEEVTKTDINGYHVNSYTVGDNVHIVTKTGLRTWDHLIQPIERGLPEFQGLSDEEYKAAATVKAQELIPVFVEEVMKLYSKDGEVSLSRLAVFAESITTDQQTTDFGFGPSISESITEINSFDMDQSDIADSSLSVSTSATLQPGYWGYVYATTDWIWVADQSSRWVEESNSYVQDTVLLGFRLNEASSTFSVYGSLPGSLLSQYSIDFYKDPESGEEYVRAATTINFGWGRWWLDGPVAEETVDESEQTSRTKNQVVIMRVPQSTDGSQSGDQLEEMGSVELGKKDESITAARFFDNISYIVTYERTDPFYVLDLSDPMEPKILGELEIPGFSEFMHPISDDNSILVTIGQDADDEGVASGFMVSIFDSTDPTDPRLLDRYVIEQRWSGSSASWDDRAFRYVRVGDLGRLIVPVSIYAGYDENGKQLGENFEGFYVFGVDLAADGDLITKELEIDHTSSFWGYINQPNPSSCYCMNSLPERSMVFDGNLMTIKGEEVVSMNLVTEAMNWNITFGESVLCCGSNVEF